MKQLSCDLDQIRADHRYRYRRLVETGQYPEMRVDGQNVISFCSNDYLGLAMHPKVRQAAVDAVQRIGVGSGASHLINGHAAYHAELERTLAKLLHWPKVLVFSTGYMANIAICQSLMQPGDTIFADRLSHASLLDGARLSGARLQRYPHADVTALEEKLKASHARKKMIITDGVFSMDGDIAPLKALLDLANGYDCWLLVDDAHGFGVLGETGCGSMEAQGIKHADRLILMATLGKACGVSGAFVAGSEILIDYLIQTARTYIFTTASPPALAAAALAGLKLIESTFLREKLRHNIQFFKHLAQHYQLNLMLDTMTPIQCVLCKTNERVSMLGEQLWEDGFLVMPIRPPTVPKGTARLRITLSAAHTENQIERLVKCLAERLAVL